MASTDNVPLLDDQGNGPVEIQEPLRVLDGHRWVLAHPVPEVERDLPASIRSMIERKIGQLGAADRRVLLAASLQGGEFDSTVVAEALGSDPAEVEERLAELERVHAFVRLAGEGQLPDRTPTLRYRFVHVLYQHAFTALLGPTRRRQLSAALARALSDHHGDQRPTLASELAHLYADAWDFGRAAEHCLIAARRAAGVFACREAAALARRGLALLERLPATPDRDRQEILLQLTLGFSLSVTQGYATPETGRSMARHDDPVGRVGVEVDEASGPDGEVAGERYLVQPDGQDAQPPPGHRHVEKDPAAVREHRDLPEADRRDGEFVVGKRAVGQARRAPAERLAPLHEPDQRVGVQEEHSARRLPPDIDRRDDVALDPDMAGEGARRCPRPPCDRDEPGHGLAVLGDDHRIAASQPPDP